MCSRTGAPHWVSLTHVPPSLSLSLHLSPSLSLSLSSKERAMRGCVLLLFWLPVSQTHCDNTANLWKEHQDQALVCIVHYLPQVITEITESDCSLPRFHSIPIFLHSTHTARLSPGSALHMGAFPSPSWRAWRQRNTAMCAKCQLPLLCMIHIRSNLNHLITLSLSTDSHTGWK